MKGGRAVTVVYVDSVFVLNAAMDYLLFLVTARLAGVTLRRGRYLLAALAGGGYAVAVFLPGGAFLAAAPAKLAVGVLLALLAFGGEEKLLRMILLLFAIACALAGCVLALGLLTDSTVPAVNGVFYTDIDAKVLLVAASAAYLVLTVVFRAAARHGLGGELLPVRVCIGGRVTELTALWDSGNALRDPAGGAGGAGGGARRPERQPAPGAAPSAVTGAAGISGGPDGSGPAKSAGAAAQAAAIPYGGNACRDASDGADGLGGDRRDEV